MYTITDRPTQCERCGAPFPPLQPGEYIPHYRIVAATRELICIDCTDALDLAHIASGEPITLYITHIDKTTHRGIVCNSGNLKIPAMVFTNQHGHNWYGVTRHDIYMRIGDDIWWGVNYSGGISELARFRRLDPNGTAYATAASHMRYLHIPTRA